MSHTTARLKEWADARSAHGALPDGVEAVKAFQHAKHALSVEWPTEKIQFGLESVMSVSGVAPQSRQQVGRIARRGTGRLPGMVGHRGAFSPLVPRPPRKKP
jgi:hypothetical protein